MISDHVELTFSVGKKGREVENTKQGTQRHDVLEQGLTHRGKGAISDIFYCLFNFWAFGFL